MKHKFAAKKFAANKFASGRYAGVGVSSTAGACQLQLESGTGWLLTENDYYLLLESCSYSIYALLNGLDYRCTRTRPMFHAYSSRPHYAVKPDDRWR